jgi:hypothetical protein
MYWEEGIMIVNKILGGNLKIAAVAIPVLVIVFPFGYSIVTSLFAKNVEMSEMFLEMPDPQYENCIKDVAYMRYHHWELLRKTREEVVRYGIRGDVGLKKCGECHTSRERFCDKCHNAVSMKPGCYGCHYYP